MSKKDEKDNLLTFLAFPCWIVPLFGLAIPTVPGAWWMYLLWLLVGTAVLMAVESKHGAK